MKKSLLLCLLALAGGTIAFAKNVEKSPEQKEEILVGGYTPAQRVDKDDRQIFDATLQNFKAGKKYFPISVSTQVVAGTNFLFIAVEEDKDNFETCRVCKIKIFRPLPGRGNARVVSVDYVPAKKDDPVFLKAMAPFVKNLRRNLEFWLAIVDRDSADLAAKRLPDISREYMKAQKEFYAFSKKYSEQLKISEELGIYFVQLRKSLQNSTAKRSEEVLRKNQCYGSETLIPALEASYAEAQNTK